MSRGENFIDAVFTFGWKQTLSISKISLSIINLTFVSSFSIIFKTEAFPFFIPKFSSNSVSLANSNLPHPKLACISFKFAFLSIGNEIKKKFLPALSFTSKFLQQVAPLKSIIIFLYH